MCGCGEECCKNCCYSTPFVTLSAVSLAGLGLLGFTISSIYGLAQMSTVPHLQNGTVVLAPVIGAMVAVTLVPLVVITILAYCVTGYIRDVLFHSVIKSCIGTSCNIWLMVVSFIYIILWLLLVVGFSGIMVFYIQAEIKCASLGTITNNSDCFAYVDSSFNEFDICSGDGLEELCSDGLNVGLSFSIALLFVLIVISGLVFLLTIQSANYVTARDNIEFRRANYPRNDAFFMKRVR